MSDSRTQSGSWFHRRGAWELKVLPPVLLLQTLEPQENLCFGSAVIYFDNTVLWAHEINLYFFYGQNLQSQIFLNTKFERFIVCVVYDLIEFITSLKYFSLWQKFASIQRKRVLLHYEGWRISQSQTRTTKPQTGWTSSLRNVLGPVCPPQTWKTCITLTLPLSKASAGDGS